MIVAGERSGDLYGAELALPLRERLRDLEIFGGGGEAMRRAGVDTVVDAHQLTMIGITEVIGGLPRAYRAFHVLLAEVDKRRPQLAVLIDFPHFNLRLPPLGDDDITADRNYIKEFVMAHSRELGRQYGVEYAEAFHYIEPGASGADRDSRVDTYVNQHAVPLK